MRRLAIACIAALAAMNAAAQVAPEQARATAVRVLDHLDRGEFAQVEAMFDADMAKAVPADKLKAVWESLPAQVGKATGRGDAQTMEQAGSTLVHGFHVYACRYQAARESRRGEAQSLA